MFHHTSRRARWAWVAAIGLAAGVMFAQDRSSRKPIAISGLGAGAVAVDQQWRFHPGDDRTWAAPDFDDSGWRELDAARPWGQQGYAGYYGFAWYRRQIELSNKQNENTQYALLLPEVGQAYELYWNGALIGRCGRLPPQPVWFYDQRPQVFLLPGTQGLLAVRVWNAPPLSDEDPGQKGGFAAAPLVGTASAIANARDALNYQRLRRRQFRVAENLLYALVALLSFLVWLRNRQQWVLFWMTGFTLPSVAMSLLQDFRLAIPYTFAMAVVQPINSVRDVSLWFLLLWLMRLRADRRLLRTTRGLAVLTLSINVLDGVLVAVAWHPELLRTAQTGDAIIAAVNTLTQFFPLALVVAAVVRHRRMDGPSLVVAVSALLVEMVNVVRDASAQGLRFTHWPLRALIDGPIFTLGGSAVSLTNALDALLFLCIVYAVFASFLEHHRHEMVVDHELRSAREVQRVLVPDTPFDLPGFRMMSAYLPAQEVGGDFFQVFAPEDGTDESFTVVIGDVSGKGLTAAMSVSFLVGAFRAADHPACRPAELLRRVNGCVSGRLGGGFATCLVLRVERNGTCAAASAGHPGPFIEDRELELPGALPLGILPSAQFEERRFELGAGQVCALYTDGLLEARNRAGELYGFERLEMLFAGRPTAEQAAGAAAEFGQNDDITVVMIARERVGESVKTTPAREREAMEEPAPVG